MLVGESSRRSTLEAMLRLLRASLLMIAPTLALPVSFRAQNQDDEIVATLTGGRVIVHATREVITFAVLDEPMEAGGAPPRVVSLDTHHIGVLLGAEEWKMPADPKPIRLDRGTPHIGGQDPAYRGSYNGEAEPDLETIGVAFLEKLTPLAARLHHKLDFPADQSLFELVVIGFGPQDYGPEVWLAEYRMTQAMIASRGDYWQTRVLRPRFVQIYPPEKHAPRKLVETCYPGECKGPTLQQLIEGNEPTLEKLAKSDPKLLKAVNFISEGQAQKAAAADATGFLKLAIPQLYADHHYIMGTFEEQRGFQWIVPPTEPVEKVEKAKEEKNRPPEAPTLRKRIEPPG